MKTLSVLTIASVSLLVSAANAASVSQQNCTLMGAPAHGPVSSVQTVSFDAPTTNAIGALERKATLGKVTATIGEGGSQTYVNIQDAQGKVFFAAAFEGAATYATPRYTFQIKCQ